MLRAQIDNDRDSVGGSGIPEVTFRPLPFAEHRTFAKRSHVKHRKGFDMTYIGSTRVVDQASGPSFRCWGALRHQPCEHCVVLVVEERRKIANLFGIPIIAVSAIIPMAT